MTPNEVVQQAQNKNIVLRAAIPADGPAILTVARAAFPHGNWWNVPANCVRYNTVATAANSLQCMVAEVNNQIVGYIFFKIKKSDVYISDTGVHPNHQGSGIGALLLAYAVAWGNEKQKRAVTLYTENNQQGATMRNKYAALGLSEKEFGYTTDDDENDDDSRPMKGAMSNVLKSIEQKL